MPDLADDATATQELELRAALAARAAARQPRLIPTGFCFNCGDAVQAGHLFCEPLESGHLSECQQDYERRTRRAA